MYFKVNLLQKLEMMTGKLEDKLCLTDRQSGVYIVGNRGKERGRNPGWISQHVIDAERKREDPGRNGKVYDR